MIYCQSLFLKGSGLGTRLFPWARCRIFSVENNVPMLYPQWVQPRLGPLLRGGIDYKAYKNQILLLNLFQKQAGDVGGLKRLQLQRTALKEPESNELNLARFNGQRDVVIEFRGDMEHFETLHGQDEFLNQEIRRMTRSHWLAMADRIKDVPIGINVRLGNDFKNAATQEDYFTKGAIKTPLTWFVKSLKTVRDILGFPAAAYVVSDGTEKALEELLKLENVHFVRPGCAISDLLVLSKAKVFLAAGGSSFSAWASFLGQMPTISHPGQSMKWFKITNRHGYYVGEFDPDAPAPPTGFVESIVKSQGWRQEATV